MKSILCLMNPFVEISARGDRDGVQSFSMRASSVICVAVSSLNREETDAMKTMYSRLNPRTKSVCGNVDEGYRSIKPDGAAHLFGKIL